MKQDVAPAKQLVKPGGLICGDDLELQAGQVDPAHVDAHLPEDAIHVPANVQKAIVDFLGTLQKEGG